MEFAKGDLCMVETIEFQLNGKPANVQTESDRLLLWVLRTDLALTGTRCGCGIGFCGACTVLVGKKALRSCQVTLKEIKGQDVLTIEGLAQGDQLHPLQQAFVDHGALQCGFCTSGMILNACGLLLNNGNPSEAEIVREMNDNLCRCGTHPRIIKAILSAARAMKGGAR
jgi:aerobic-type carbon monoxide dehydrogenase small subunit (CoxS/CutS family)